MNPGQKVGIWLRDEAAKLFLGLAGKRPVSRWIVIGDVMEGEQPPIGVWIHIEFIEERRPIKSGKIKHVRWFVKPGQSLIRWEYIISAQNLKNAEVPEDPRPDPGQYL